MCPDFLFSKLGRKAFRIQKCDRVFVPNVLFECYEFGCAEKCYNSLVNILN